ncbi:type IV pilus biogenesis/stability protein PilW [Pseudoalteromonas sp. CO325X]|uniref:type IV pilus biogenesis/stability protein PilW n=1 Tax=Pseudoalteromonas sp. CO325X TaxID=1777262 RepID=UPI001023608D|nr:type IV pilus biogenesis/stability protein PilW [Pseudoalteromonas sp. CO325X]RZF77794.1 type IV pilus biogenesis/stability protein PilW [Pseudoalteromonas sp. CO325X]
MRKLLVTSVSLLALGGCVTESTYVGSDRPVVEKRINNVDAARTRISLALNYLSQGNSTQAKYNLERAAKFAPELPEVHYSMAYYYQRVGEHQRAQDAYERAIELEPNDPNTLNNYGVFLCDIGDYEGAVDKFMSAIEIPSYLRVAESYENLALCALEFDKFDAAESYLEEALNHSSLRASSLINLAAVHYAKSDFYKAQQVLQRYERTGRVSSRSLLLGYLIQDRMGHVEDARKLAETIELTYPSSIEARIVREQRYSASEFEQLREQYRKHQLSELQGVMQDDRIVAKPKIKVVKKKSSTSTTPTTAPVVVTSPAQQQAATSSVEQTQEMVDSAHENSDLVANDDAATTSDKVEAANTEVEAATTEVDTAAEVVKAQTSDTETTHTEQSATEQVNADSQDTAVVTTTDTSDDTTTPNPEPSAAQSAAQPSDDSSDSAQSASQQPAEALQASAEIDEQSTSPADLPEHDSATQDEPETTTVTNEVDTVAEQQNAEVTTQSEGADSASDVVAESNDGAEPPSLSTNEQAMAQVSDAPAQHEGDDTTPVDSMQAPDAQALASEDVVVQQSNTELSEGVSEFIAQGAQVDSDDPLALPYHVMKKGETLFSVSARYNIRLSTLREWNNLKSADHVLSGSKIYLKEPNIYHTVQEGDTLFSISTQYNILLQRLMEWNQLDEGARLVPGEKLYLVDPQNY